VKAAVMTAAGELTGIVPVVRSPLAKAKFVRKPDQKFAICDESIEPGSLVLQGSQRIFFFSG